MEILAVSLIAVIALSEVSRLFLTHSKVSKKTHFKNKLEGVEKMIYDLEFKRFKTREIREDIRQEYDQRAARLATIDQKLATFPLEERITDEQKKERAVLEDQKLLAERDANRFSEQMKQLDVEVNGAKPTSEDPDGSVGITGQIDSLRELKEMLKSWIETL